MTVMEEVEQIEVLIVAEEVSCIPTYATLGASGADLKAHIDAPITLQPQETILIPTGCKMAVPLGYEIQVRPRSGLALKSGITVLNTPGTIDADYRGQIGVILINHSKNPFEITPGMRIAQAVIAKVVIANFIQTEELPTTARGSGGFGHSGTH